MALQGACARARAPGPPEALGAAWAGRQTTSLPPDLTHGQTQTAIDRPIDQKNANGSQPKSTESGPRFFGSPSESADLIFLSVDTRGLCIENNTSTKKTDLILKLIPN